MAETEYSKIRLDSDIVERFSSIAQEENMSLTALVNMILRNIKTIKRIGEIEIKSEHIKTKKSAVISRNSWSKQY